MANFGRDSVSVVDAEEGRLVASIKTGIKHTAATVKTGAFPEWFPVGRAIAAR